MLSAPGAVYLYGLVEVMIGSVIFPYSWGHPPSYGEVWKSMEFDFILQVWMSLENISSFPTLFLIPLFNIKIWRLALEIEMF